MRVCWALVERKNTSARLVSSPSGSVLSFFGFCLFVPFFSSYVALLPCGSGVQGVRVGQRRRVSGSRLLLLLGCICVLCMYLDPTRCAERPEGAAASYKLGLRGPRASEAEVRPDRSRRDFTWSSGSTAEAASFAAPAHSRWGLLCPMESAVGGPAAHASASGSGSPGFTRAGFGARFGGV